MVCEGDGKKGKRHGRNFGMFFTLNDERHVNS